jgi:putative tricarboxylic transport membrane protein
MTSFLIACVAGVCLGYLVGLLPGIGVSMVLIILYPFLIKISLPFVLVFYCCMVSAAQFGGSVTAIAIGVPGEQNSYPLLAVRPQIINDGKESEVLFLCAAGHFLGSIIVFGFIYLFIDLIADQTTYLKTYVLVIMCCLGILLSILTSKEKLRAALLMAAAGWVVSKVGMNPVTGKEFLVFGNSYLAGGLPLIAVITGFWVVPVILELFYDNKKESNNFNQTPISILEMYLLIKNNFINIIRGSLLGFISGLIPYVGVDLSSYIGFYVEKISKNNYIKQIAAAEVATNAAAVSVLLPLLIYGIAIQLSENILLDIVNSSDRFVLWKTVEPFFPELALCIVLANCMSFILSWNLALPMLKLLNQIKIYIPWVMIVLCVYSMIMVGNISGQSNYYLLIMIIFGIGGYLLRNRDRLIFILVFLLQGKLEPAIIRLIDLYL